MRREIECEAIKGRARRGTEAAKKKTLTLLQEKKKKKTKIKQLRQQRGGTYLPAIDKSGGESTCE